MSPSTRKPPNKLDPDEVRAATAARLPGWRDVAIDVEPLTKGGSDRAYYRLTSRPPHSEAPTVVFMAYTDRRPDNLAFASATEILARHDVNVPRILAGDDSNWFLWLEDLGNNDLWHFRGEPWKTRRPLWRAALTEVAKVHEIKEHHLDDHDRKTLQPGFDENLYAWEQEYFFNRFLRQLSNTAPGEIDALAGAPWLADLRRRLATLPRRLVHRDFQSQNVLIRDGRTILIDYQGLRPGQPEYDLASLVYDPYVAMPMGERDQLILDYLDARPTLKDDARFRQSLNDTAIQRLMQALGAYGFLGHNEGKHRFLDYIHPALGLLRDVLDTHDCPGARLLGENLRPENITVPEPA